MTKFDEQYRQIVFDAINGERVLDRTGVGTRKVFGREMRFDLQEEFPAPTLKKLFFETAKKEMFWIYQDQSNDVKLLQEKYGVKVWNEWARPDMTIGKAYGYQVRKHAQIDKLIHKLRTEPHGRRHYMHLLDLGDEADMALAPCAFMTIWNVEKGRLNCQLVQRSGDLGLGVPFNTGQYAVLVHMIAQVVGLEVGVLWHTITDAHVYESHVEPLKEMLFLPIKEEVKPQIEIITDTTDFYEFKPEDIVLTGYDSHPHIHLPVAV